MYLLSAIYTLYDSHQSVLCHSNGKQFLQILIPSLKQNVYCKSSLYLSIIHHHNLSFLQHHHMIHHHHDLSSSVIIINHNYHPHPSSFIIIIHNHHPSLSSITILYLRLHYLSYISGSSITNFPLLFKYQYNSTFPFARLK